MSLLTSFRMRGRGRRGLAAGAAALGAATLAVGLTVAPASADPYTQPLRSLGGSGQWYLGSNGGSVFGTTSAPTWQFWDNFAFSKETYVIQASGTSNCLDGNEAGSMYTSPCNSKNTYENWNIGGGNDMGFTFQSFQTGLCLNLDPGNGAINAIACNWNNLNEVWTY